MDEEWWVVTAVWEQPSHIAGDDYFLTSMSRVCSTREKAEAIAERWDRAGGPGGMRRGARAATVTVTSIPA